MTAPAAPGNLATPADRFIAFLIDWAILIVVAIVIGILQAILSKIHLGFVGILLGLVQMVISVGYFIYLWSVENPYTGKGQTIGKKMRGIKIIKADGTDLTVGDAVIRYIGYIVSGVVIWLGFIWIFIDANKQGWHDKIAKTYVIKV
jgi:uncharacterized RDD family membrane protein YckC